MPFGGLAKIGGIPRTALLGVTCHDLEETYKIDKIRLYN